MKDSILTNKQDIWPQITATVRRATKPCMAAIAYIGKGGAHMLPLPSGSKLVVDASLAAVRSGQTCPQELINLQRKDVEIYSLAGLHAKVVVANKRVFIGSANVSHRSARVLKEAVFATGNPMMVQQATEFIDSLPAFQLGPRELKMLQKEYREPRNVPQAAENDGGVQDPSVFVYFLNWEDYDEGAKKIVARGQRKAEKKWTKKKGFILDDFQWDGTSIPQKKDYVMHVMRENGKHHVFPPGKMVHTEYDPVGNRHFIWSEMVNIDGVAIGKLSKSYQNAIGSRSGKRNNIDVAGLQKELKRLVK